MKVDDTVDDLLIQIYINKDEIRISVKPNYDVL